EGWLRMSTAVRQESSLDGDCRELVIIRVVDRLGCALEVNAHTPFALKEGASEAQLAALAEWESSDLFTPKQRAALQYADISSRDVRVPDAVFDNLRAHFDD